MMMSADDHRLKRRREGGVVAEMATGPRSYLQKW